jgi:hypothetical protein
VAPSTTTGASSRSNLTPAETQQPSPSTSSTSPNSSQTSPFSSTSSPDASSGNLSSGAKAGIGIGATIGSLLLFGLIAYLFFQYGKRTAVKTGIEEPSFEKAELETGNPQPRPAELGSNLRYEMDGTGKAVEIDGPGGGV